MNTDELDEESFNMDDLENDKELQAELRMMGWKDNAHKSQEKSQKKATPAKPPKTITSVKEVERNFVMPDIESFDEDNVEFTEEDMMDPDLLSQLQALNGDNAGDDLINLEDDNESENKDENYDGNDINENQFNKVVQETRSTAYNIQQTLDSTVAIGSLKVSKIDINESELGLYFNYLCSYVLQNFLKILPY
jgi:hypothetical protein